MEYGYWVIGEFISTSMVGIFQVMVAIGQDSGPSYVMLYYIPQDKHAFTHKDGGDIHNLSLTSL